jgi:hypothetical protein
MSVFSAKEQRSGLFADIAREKADAGREDWKRSGLRHQERERGRIRKSFGIEEVRKATPPKPKKSEFVGDDVNNSLVGIASEQNVRPALLDPIEVIGVVLDALVDDPLVAKALLLLGDKIKEAQHACEVNQVNLKRSVTTLARERFKGRDSADQALFYLMTVMLR